MLLQQIGELKKRSGPRAGADARPAAVIKGRFGRGHRPADILSVALGHDIRLGARRWVDERAPLAGGRLHQLAIDQYTIGDNGCERHALSLRDAARMPPCPPGRPTATALNIRGQPRWW